MMSATVLSLEDARKLAANVELPQSNLNSLLSIVSGYEASELHQMDLMGLTLTTKACVVLLSIKNKGVAIDFNEEEFVAGPAKLPMRIDYGKKLLSYLNVTTNL